MRMVYRYMVILCLFFIVPDTLRADGEDVLERMISLPKMKGTVYSLLGNISQQSGYLFIYDSKVVDNDVTVKIRKGERTIRQAIYEITGDTSLEFRKHGSWSKLIFIHICTCLIHRDNIKITGETFIRSPCKSDAYRNFTG